MNVPEYMRLNKRGCDVCVLQERMWFVFLVFLALCGLWRIDKLKKCGVFFGVSIYVCGFMMRTRCETL